MDIQIKWARNEYSTNEFILCRNIIPDFYAKMPIYVICVYMYCAMNNKSIVIALSLLSLSILTITVNVQPYSPSPVFSTKSVGSSGDTQMGICLVGAGGSCNGDR